LLLLPLLIGGYLAAVFVFKAAHGVAAAPWRGAILIGYALVGALLTDLIAGLGTGAHSSSHFWPLLPCFWLITSAVALAAAAVQAVVGKWGTVLVALLFIAIGGPPACGLGTYLLPVYWRNIGVILPPQSAVTLVNHVLYFHGNDISTPLVVLFLYAAAGTAVIAWFGRIRPAGSATAARGAQTQAPPGNATSTPNRRRAAIAMLVALGICAVMQSLFATTYMSAGHAPKASNMPFGTVGSSPVLTEAQKKTRRSPPTSTTSSPHRDGRRVRAHSAAAGPRRRAGTRDQPQVVVLESRRWGQPGAVFVAVQSPARTSPLS